MIRAGFSMRYRDIVYAWKDENDILDRENVAIPTYIRTFFTYSLSCASLLVLIIQICLLLNKVCT